MQDKKEVKMSYYEFKGQMEDLKKRRQICESAINSHRESLRAALNPALDTNEIQSDYIVELSIALREDCIQYNAYAKKIAVLQREIGE